MPTSNQIVVSGAREHNLKDISLTLPRDALVVITGLSGSGKSSLAFDTIYAEGQRRYVESLSAYARQFLGQMDKPDVDSIEGLSPAISIDQKTTSRNPRSTVGTVTEIYDYLRLLWSRVGKPHCPICGRPIVGQSAEQIIDQVMELPEGARFMVMAPVVRGRKGEYGKLLEELRADGFARVRIDDRIRLLEESIVLDKRYKHDISVVIDRLIMRHDVRKRLADSIETAVRLADGLVEVEMIGSAARSRSAERGDGEADEVAQSDGGVGDIARSSARGARNGRAEAVGASGRGRAAGARGAKGARGGADGESSRAAKRARDEADGVGSRGAGSTNGDEAERSHSTGALGARAGNVQIVPGEMPPEGTVFTFSERFACPEHGPSLVELEPRIFSFNSPHGACERCHGLGAQMEIDPEMLVPDPTLSVAEGAIAPWSNSVSNYYEQVAGAIAEQYGVDLDVPWEDLPLQQREIFLNGSPDPLPISYRNRFGRRRSYSTRFAGIVANLERRYRETESEGVKEKLEEYMSLRACPTCGGARLRAESRAVLVGGTRIEDFCALSARRALEWLEQVELSETDRHVARLILREISERLQFLENVGIGYLSMDRGSATLSGEAQRIRLATQIGSSLVGVLYILDEPSIGLHQRDNSKLIATLERLRELGNTVIVVEHDEQTMRAADHLVDLGPGAGEHGGRIVAQGTAAQVQRCKESLTGQFLAGTRTVAVPAKRRTPTGYVKVEGAAQHNLRDIDASFPLGTLTCVTGVSGSGKSTLVNEILYKALAARLHRARQRPGAHRAIRGLDQLDKIIAVDQSPIGRTPRSNPATYTGLFDVIRDLYSKTQEARARGYKPGRFSFNVKGGRCEVCKGDGQIKIEMHFLPDVYVPCEQCHGKRYNRETLEVRFKGKSIADVLDMPIEEAVSFFEHIPKVRRRLETLNAVGLGYVRLGQPATTLSGGEAQRVKLATELSKVATGRTLYILDEPTTGLHFADVQRLLEVLQRLVDAGNSVVVIEHNLDVIKCADRLIDMGPEGGEEGGMVVAAGTPEEIAAEPASHTGQFLAQLLAETGMRAEGECLPASVDPGRSVAAGVSPNGKPRAAVKKSRPPAAAKRKPRAKAPA